MGITGKIKATDIKRRLKFVVIIIVLTRINKYNNLYGGFFITIFYCKSYLFKLYVLVDVIFHRIHT